MDGRQRCHKDIGAEAFVTLYKHLIRSHLKYNNSVWSPHKKSDIEKLERVQKRATKMIPGMPKISYPDRLRKLKLPTNFNVQKSQRRHDRDVQVTVG